MMSEDFTWGRESHGDEGWGSLFCRMDYRLVTRLRLVFFEPKYSIWTVEEV